MDLREYVLLALIAIMFASGIYVYPQMPDPMATHWGFEGEVNGYSSRNVGVFLTPFITLGIYLIFLIIPKIAVYKKNIMSFYEQYFLLKAVTVVFLSLVYAAVIFSNLGYAFKINYIIMPALGILFYALSFVLEKSKKNFFVGIRTPWTLSSDTVWEKTHKLGAKMFRVLAIVALASALFPKGIMLFIAIAISGTLFLVIYSYIEYEKEKKN